MKGGAEQNGEQNYVASREKCRLFRAKFYESGLVAHPLLGDPTLPNYVKNQEKNHLFYKAP